MSMLALVFLACFPEDVSNFLHAEEFTGAEGKEIFAVLEEMGTCILNFLLVFKCN